MTSGDQMLLHRSQGALAVLDAIFHMERDLKGIEQQMSEQKEMEKKALEAAEAALP